PGMADPLLDVPEGADPRARRRPEGEGRGGEAGIRVRRRPGRLLGLPQGEAAAAEVVRRRRAEARRRGGARGRRPTSEGEPSGHRGTGTHGRTYHSPAMASPRDIPSGRVSITYMQRLT